jgi:chromosome segregation ATPase
MSSSDAAMTGASTAPREERAALEGMLRGYPVEQLVEEVMTAWDELAERNDELVEARQRLRMAELDLADRTDAIAPEVARLNETEHELRDARARIVHLERLLEDARDEASSLAASASAEERANLQAEVARLTALSDEQDQVIGEMEERVGRMVVALERAAEAGLTSVTAEEVRRLKNENEEALTALAAEQATVHAMEEERQRLRDIADRLRGLIDARDQRLAELEDQVERVMSGPKSISAEHDYLVEQIEDLKRRLLERNREYESLRRRERRLHNDVFDRDERLAQMTLTMTDLEAALQDRTAEARDLEERLAAAEDEVARVRRGERTREVVGKAFSDTLGLVRGHDQREAARSAYAEAPDVERTIAAPGLDDMERLAKGEVVDLDVSVEEVPVGTPTEEVRPNAPGGRGDPVVYEDED